MLAKRIIPCLDVKDGRTVKGVNFVDLRDAGDPVELAWNYSRQGADELVFLDITATHERRKTMVELVKAVARQVNIQEIICFPVVPATGKEIYNDHVKLFARLFPIHNKSSHYAMQALKFLSFQDSLPGLSLKQVKD